MTVKHSRSIFAMNNPNEPLRKEIPFLLECGVDGVEITIENPCSYFPHISEAWPLVQEHARVLHTRDDLQFASTDQRERESALEVMYECFSLSKKLGMKRINVHPHRGTAGLDPSQIFNLNVQSLSSLAKVANEQGLELMLENQPPFTSAEQIKSVLEAVDGELFLLLDIAHAYCYNDANEIPRYFELLGDSVRHVHISDNRNGKDEHLFPGYGEVPFSNLISLMDKYVDPSVALSLESFRIAQTTELRMVTNEQRPSYVSAAIEFLKDLG